MGSRVIHIIHNSVLFVASTALSSRLEVVHVNHNVELFLAFRIVHIIYIPELLISSKGLSSWDPESFISPLMLSYSKHPQP